MAPVRSDNGHEQPSVPASRASPETGGVPYKSADDLVSRWSNVFNILVGRMSSQGREQFRKDRDVRNEAKDCKRCEEHRDYLLSYSPIVRFMRDNINQLGSDINNENIRCRRCDRDQRQSGGFDPQFGILVCANELRNRGHLEDTMAHEMVHAYDHLRFQVDWANNLKHAACTEIRASSLSGECRFMREFFTRGQWRVTQQHQECVRRRAVLSVMARPACKSKEEAEQVVNSVWDSCFSDTRPFDEIYR